MAVMDGEGSVTWITVEYDAGNREWEARCEGRAFRYPLDCCASGTGWNPISIMGVTCGTSRRGSMCAELLLVIL